MNVTTTGRLARILRDLDITTLVQDGFPDTGPLSREWVFGRLRGWTQHDLDRNVSGRL